MRLGELFNINPGRRLNLAIHEEKVLKARLKRLALELMRGETSQKKYSNESRKLTRQLVELREEKLLARREMGLKETR